MTKTVLVGFIICLFGVANGSATDKKPNILLVIADDMGIDASPCYDVGALKPKMPNLENLCTTGLVFDNFYTNPMCSPTRASMITGRYGFRTGVGTAVGPNLSNGLRLDEKTLFQTFSDEAPDYNHAVIGKWHLATHDNGGIDHPNLAGVGYYSGLLTGTVDDYSDWWRTSQGQTGKINRYVTSVFTDEAISWVEKQGQKPWFLWLAHVAPHTPFHLPPNGLYSDRSLTGSLSDIRQNPLKYYFAALEALDKELGRFLKSMSKSVRDNTVIMFIGDNGSPNRSVQSPYEKGRAKASVFDGGTHAPLIVTGNGVLRKGEREDALINSTDIFATISELAGIAKSAISSAVDSISFAPLLNNDKEHERKFAYVEYFGVQGSKSEGRRTAQYGWAIRDQQYKYIKLENGEELIFNMKNDLAENENLIGALPNVAIELEAVRDGFQLN